MCPQTPTGRPYPSTAQAEPEGLGCNRRCVGVVSLCAHSPPRGVPIPPRPGQDRRDSGVTAGVWGRDLSVCPQSPTGRPYPSAARAGPEGLGCNRCCVKVVSSCARNPPWGVPSPPRPRQDRRDSGVTAAVWGRDLSVCPQSPTGGPYPSAAQAGPEGLGCNRRCVGVVSLCARNPPRGARIPPRPKQDRKDSGVTTAVWGRDLSVCPQTPTGRPYPSAAQAGPEGLGCNRRCVGVVSLCARNPPWGARIPPRPKQDRRDSGVTAAAWGRDLTVRPLSPTGRPYSSAAPSGSEGLGCNRRCVGVVSLCARNPPWGVPIPPRPGQDRRDSGVTAAVWGRDLTVCPQSPTGRPYPSAAQAGPEGLGCNRRCVGEGPLRVPTIPHGASLSLRGPGRTGGTRV